MFIIQTLLSSFFIWCIIIAFLGLLQGKKKSVGSSEKNITSNDKAENFSRFAVVICAHDEENVIGNLLENLQSQNYPAEKFHVFVLADHCSDGTVKKAKAFANVTVWERTGGERSGKGAVLNWGMKKILQKQNDFERVLFFDADNQIRPDFLQQMNGAFLAGAEIVTGRRLTENPFDSLISQWYTLYWAVVNSLYNRPRQNLGLSSMLSGTGFAFRMELLQGSGWKTYSLSEDIEFTFLENLKGHCVTYLNDAIFYDEQPVRLSVMWTQLRRWCTGDFQIAFRYFGQWVKAFVKNPSWRLWDIFMGVGMTVFFGLTAVSYLIHGALLIWQGQLGVLVVSTLLSYVATISVGFAAAAKSSWPVKKLLPGILTFPVFYSLFSYISLQSLFFPQKKWVRIEHKSSKMHF
ncbi:MAG: glycosyltransferase family 2 protein [Acidaminococcaceae bacterium]|nr:glycosyltransferase family 2 protein [Acidaminococcaceae bacterium]